MSFIWHRPVLYVIRKRQVIFCMDFKFFWRVKHDSNNDV